MDDNNDKPAKPVMNRNMTDVSIGAIENSIGGLTSRQMELEAEIAELQDKHRHTVRSVAAFRLALRMLQQ